MRDAKCDKKCEMRDEQKARCQIKKFEMRDKKCEIKNVRCEIKMRDAKSEKTSPQFRLATSLPGPSCNHHF